MRGSERLTVCLVRVGDVLGGVLHVGEHVLGSMTWSLRTLCLRARCRGSHGPRGDTIQGEDRR